MMRDHNATGSNELQAVGPAMAELFTCYFDAIAGNDAEGLATLIKSPSAMFYKDKVNVFNTSREAVETVLRYYNLVADAGLPAPTFEIKAKSLNASDHCTVWVETTFDDDAGTRIARSLTRFFCQRDVYGDYLIHLIEVLEHDAPALPDPKLWAGQERGKLKKVPAIAERRTKRRKPEENARSREDFAAFTVIEDTNLLDTWSNLVLTKMAEGRGTLENPNGLFAPQMRIYVDDDSISLRSAIGLYAYLGGFQARLAMAGAVHSETIFDSIASNHKNDVLVRGKWTWHDVNGAEYHLADVDYIFENYGQNHRISVISYSNIDPALRPRIAGAAPQPLPSPRLLRPVGD